MSQTNFYISVSDFLTLYKTDIHFYIYLFSAFYIPLAAYVFLCHFSIKAKKMVMFWLVLFLITIYSMGTLDIPSQLRSDVILTQKDYLLVEQHLRHLEGNYDNLYMTPTFMHVYEESSRYNLKRTHRIENKYINYQRYFDTLYNPDWIYFLYNFGAIMLGALFLEILGYINKGYCCLKRTYISICKYIHPFTPRFKAEQRAIEKKRALEKELEIKNQLQLELKQKKQDEIAKKARQKREQQEKKIRIERLAIKAQKQKIEDDLLDMLS